MSLIKSFCNYIFSTQCVLCHFNAENQQLICQSCFETLPHYSAKMTVPHITALFQYTEPISALIWRLKFQGNLAIANWFSQCWINYLKKHEKILLPEIILPVPLHAMRLKERGFNQALEIAKPIGKYFSIPVDTQTCVRLKNTTAQSSLTGNQREKNMKNAFGLSYTVSAKHIAILDDVHTTGSTTSEISALLKKSGVEKVDVWCCAKTV